MTVQAFVANARRASGLGQQPCVRASVGYARALLLDFGALRLPDKTGFEEPERGVVAECPWRLDSGTRVIVGSGDPEDTIEPRLQTCVGEVVSSVDVYRPSYMLRIQLSGALTLWVFPDDSRDFAQTSEYSRSAWFVTGYAYSSDPEP